MVLWYSLRFYLLGTHPNSTFPVLARISIFLALARILPFLVLALIQPSRYSPGPFSGTRLDSTFLVLAWILPFWYSPGFYLFETRSDSTFLVLAQISTFPVVVMILPFPALARILPFPILAQIQPSQYSPGPFSGTRPDSTFPVLSRIPLFQYSLEFYLPRYSPGFYLFGTRLDSTFSDTRPDPTFLVLNMTHLRYSPGFLLFRHSPGFYPSPVLARISLSFPASCPDSSSSPASCPDFIILFIIMLESLIFLGIVLGLVSIVSPLFKLRIVRRLFCWIYYSPRGVLLKIHNFCQPFDQSV